jgi:hypothetical protein
MEANFIVYYSQRKGLGPDWINKNTEIGVDDLTPEDNALATIYQLGQVLEKRLKNSRSF